MQLLTKRKYPIGEATSALIKCLRRGDEELAMFFGLEIEETFPNHFWKRLAIFCMEDIGLADPDAIVRVTALWQAYTLIKANAKGPLYRVVLQGTGPLRHFTPYAPTNGHKLPVVKYPLDSLWLYEERRALWEKYLARSLDLGNGIGAVVGSNSNPTFPDLVYLVVNQAQQPTTYKAVLVWREPPSNLEAPAPPRPVRH